MYYFRKNSNTKGSWNYLTWNVKNVFDNLWNTCHFVTHNFPNVFKPLPRLPQKKINFQTRGPFEIDEKFRRRVRDIWRRNPAKNFGVALSERLPGTNGLRFRANLGNAYIRTRAPRCTGADWELVRGSDRPNEFSRIYSPECRQRSLF